MAPTWRVAPAVHSFSSLLIFLSLAQLLAIWIFQFIFKKTMHWNGPICRGVQYVHCVMHKCIMVNVGGKENHRKLVENTEIVQNQREIWGSREW